MPVNGTHANTNGNGSAPLRGKVAFGTNVPQKLTLEFDPPAEARAGRFGDQFMYFFAGNKIAWFDPPVHQQILSSGATAGEEIEICKHETRSGNRKTTKWEVVLIGPEPEEFSGPHGEYDPDYAPDARPPAPAPRQLPPVTAPQGIGRVPAEAGEAFARAGQSAPAPLPAPAATPEANPLAQALILAIDAVEIANAHGQKAHKWDEGLALGDEAIVKLAITAYIQSQGGKAARV